MNKLIKKAFALLLVLTLGLVSVSCKKDPAPTPTPDPNPPVDGGNDNGGNDNGGNDNGGGEETGLTEVLNWDFGSVNKTGYAAGELTWTNGNGTEVTAEKDRVQINTSSFAPHNDGHMLVFSIRDTHSEAWIELDFSSLAKATEISFDISSWNSTLTDTVKDTPEGKFILQVKDGDNWVDLVANGDKADLLPLLVADEYVNVKFEVEGPAVFRILYSGTSTADKNTTTALIVDNLVVKG